MRRRDRTCAAVLAVGLLGVPAGCGDPEPADPATTEVTVQFRDASVPPEYHRSWRLTLDEDKIYLVVDSYGDVVAEDTADMPRDTWESFVEELPQDLEDLDEPESVGDGCSGGTGLELTVRGGADTDLEVEDCGSDGNDELVDDIEGLVEPFTDLVHLDQHTHID